MSNVLIDGTQRKMTSAQGILDGTVLSIDHGLTKLDGVIYEIKIKIKQKDLVATVTGLAHFGSKVLFYYITPGGVQEVTNTDGSYVFLPQSEMSLTRHGPPAQTAINVYLNGNKVANLNKQVTYEWTEAKNVTVQFIRKGTKQVIRIDEV